MYVIVVYDIGVERINKIHRYLRTTMHWIQNSVFEGELSKFQLKKLKVDLNEMIDKDTDSVIIFRFPKKFLKKDILGVEKNSIDFIL